MKAARKEEFYRVYTADSLHFLLGQWGVSIKRYSEIMYPVPEDTRSPEEIANERIKKLGLKVVN